MGIISVCGVKFWLRGGAALLLLALALASVPGTALAADQVHLLQGTATENAVNADNASGGSRACGVSGGTSDYDEMECAGSGVSRPPPQPYCPTAAPSLSIQPTHESEEQASRSGALGALSEQHASFLAHPAVQALLDAAPRFAGQVQAMLEDPASVDATFGELIALGQHEVADAPPAMRAGAAKAITAMTDEPAYHAALTQLAGPIDPAAADQLAAQIATLSPAELAEQPTFALDHSTCDGIENVNAYKKRTAGRVALGTMIAVGVIAGLGCVAGAPVCAVAVVAGGGASLGALAMEQAEDSP